MWLCQLYWRVSSCSLNMRLFLLQGWRNVSNIKVYCVHSSIICLSSVPVPFKHVSNTGVSIHWLFSLLADRLIQMYFVTIGWTGADHSFSRHQYRPYASFLSFKCYVRSCHSFSWMLKNSKLSNLFLRNLRGNHWILLFHLSHLMLCQTGWVASKSKY